MTETVIPADMLDSGLAIEMVPISALRPHPDNYRKHPQEQLDHLALSLQTNGFYRPVVTAHDLTVLAGHGIVAAAKLVGIDPVPVHRTRYDPYDPEALKLLVGDNESARLAQNDTRGLANLLEQIRDEARGGLEGTGYDDDSLTTLLELIQDMPSPAAATDAEAQAAQDMEYSRTIQSPIYQVQGEQPAPEALVAMDRYLALLDEIRSVDMPPEVSEFLEQAATRHLVFDYAQIAEYYAHAEPEVQGLMEASALVIIDAEQAIERGFMKLVGDLREIAGEDDAEDEGDFDDIPE